MRRLRRAILPLSALAALGCGGGDLVLPPGDRLEVVGGNGQTGDPGGTLGAPLVVRVVDQDGTGLAGETVTWVISAGGGTIAPGQSTTDDQGRATASWTLGPAPGVNGLEAMVTGLGSVSFTATARSPGGGEPSADESTISADPTSIVAGSGSATITVTVRDAGGDPVAGSTVVLQATGGGNTLTQPAQPTGADGVATGSLQSAEPGTKVVTAVVNGSVQVTQTAQVTVTTPGQSHVEALEGTSQSAPAGSAVPVRPAVRVLDGEGDPVEGFVVTFVVTSGGGSVQGAMQTTDGDGVARVDAWILGATPGTNTVEARAGSLAGSPVVFTAEGTSAGAVDHFVFRIQPHDVEEDEEFSVEVAMVDAAGDLVPLSGITIYLGLFEEGKKSPNNQRLAGNRFVATVDGVAVFTGLAVEKHGRYRLRALSDDLLELGPHGPEPFLFSDPFEVH